MWYGGIGKSVGLDSKMHHGRFCAIPSGGENLYVCGGRDSVRSDGRTDGRPPLRIQFIPGESMVGRTETRREEAPSAGRCCVTGAATAGGKFKMKTNVYG